VLELLAGGRVVATGVLDGSGRATFTVPPGRVLNRPVTALYLGGSAGGAPAAACQSATFVPTARWFRTHHAPSATARHPSANGHGRGRS
jgi:hypothetical protein